MASRRFRARRTLGKNVDQLAKRLRYVEKNTGKKRLNPRVVTTTKLYAKTVTTPKIADNAVTTEIIAANAVTTTEIAPGAVTTTQINFDAGDIGGMASSVTTTAPTGPNVGDIWFDASDNNNLKRWSGTAWVSVRDATIAVAQSAANAAQTTADGKNKIYRQSSTPTGTFAIGDLWFDTGNDNRISRWDGSSWVQYGLGNAAIANLDAGKITTGSLDAGRIAANTINASMIIANSITSTKIAADAIDGKTITGATLQTSNTASGKIIIDSTNGFRGIASNGVTTVQITTGGTATFTGSVTATAFTATGLVDGGVGGDLATNTITDVNIQSLNASKITAGTIDASVISVTNLNASNITAGSINAANISVTNLNASQITAGTFLGRNFYSSGTVAGGIYSGRRNLEIVADASVPNIVMYDSIGDNIQIDVATGMLLQYPNISAYANINLFSSSNRLRLDTTDTTYKLEVGGSVNASQQLRCGGALTVGGNASVGGNLTVTGTISGVVSNPLGAQLNANSFAIVNVNEVQCESGSATDPSFTFTNSLTTGMYYDGDINFSIGGTNRFYYSNSGTTFQIPSGKLNAPNGHVGTWIPSSNNVYALGTTGNRWTEVWATDVTINGSDLRLKNNVQDSILGLDFIEKLRPVSYKLNHGSVTIASPVLSDEGKITNETEIENPTRNPGKRPRYGFIAQEVKEVIDELGVDFGGWVKDDMSDPDSYQSLRYTEFIAPAVKAIQELSAKVKQLEQKVEELSA